MRHIWNLLVMAICFDGVVMGGAQAGALYRYDAVLEIGSPDHIYGTTPKIDDQSNLLTVLSTGKGPYRIGSVGEPGTGIIDYPYLVRENSTENLLPVPMRSMDYTVRGFTASGHVIGQDPAGANFFYDAEDGTMSSLRSLPGATGRLDVYDINDLDQIVGAQGGEPIFYDSPDSTPIAVKSLVANLDGWELFRATGINNKGEIVGYGRRIGEHTATFFKLEPVPTPEPASIVLFCAAILGMAGRRHQRSRIG